MLHLLLPIIYISFISLGLPDSLLGSAWPSIYPELGVPVSWAGAISMTISAMTVISSLMSDRLTRAFGTGKVTAFSVAITAAALYGFSVSHSYWLLLLWAVPYGLGAGSVDASLNNYVALHYESRHMSWLHCMWGIGTAIGPNIMGFALTRGLGWNAGYRIIAIFQTVLSACLFLSLPLWKTRSAVPGATSENSSKPLSLSQIVRIPGVREMMLCFLCYCAVEQTTGLWSGSYLTLYIGTAPETAASYAGIFYIGITIGRAVSGFLTYRLNDKQMVRLGQVLIGAGILILLLKLGETVSLIGLIVIGLGCAPIYPSLIHATPAHFGADRSQSIIGIQMAAAYVGSCLMPSIFGLIAQHIRISLLPLYLMLFLVLMFLMHEQLIRKTGIRH